MRESMHALSITCCHAHRKFTFFLQTKTSNGKLSGSKRKAQDEFLIPAKKVWGCALCEVSASSEEALKAHLQGKKHKAKEAALISNKKTGLQPSKLSVTTPLEGASEGGGESLKKKKQQKFWCGLCRVKCNSQIMMECHFSGKKHRNLMELKRVNSTFKTEAVKTVVADEKLAETQSAEYIQEELEST